MTDALAAAVAVAVALALAAHPARAEETRTRTFAGSVQLDYLAVPTERSARAVTLDGATVELSLKLSVDLTKTTSASVKVCFACHGVRGRRWRTSICAPPTSCACGSAG